MPKLKALGVPDNVLDTLHKNQTSVETAEQLLGLDTQQLVQDTQLSHTAIDNLKQVVASRTIAPVTVHESSLLSAHDAPAAPTATGSHIHDRDPMQYQQRDARSDTVRGGGDAVDPVVVISSSSSSSDARNSGSAGGGGGGGGSVTGRKRKKAGGGVVVGPEVLIEGFATCLDEFRHHAQGAIAVSTGCKSLDALLEGRGLLSRQMTEVVGPSSSGKTQLCLTVAAEVMAREATVLYIDTNGSFCHRRIKHILHERGVKDPPDKEETLLSRVRCVRAHDEKQLMAVLDRLGQRMLKAADDWHQELRLVVVDSIRSIFQPLQGRDDNGYGYYMMGMVGKMLNYLAQRYGLIVVVVNSTVIVVNRDDEPGQAGAQRRGSSVGGGRASTGGRSGRDPGVSSLSCFPGMKPALGHYWSLFPSVRVMLRVAAVEEMEKKDGLRSEGKPICEATVMGATSQPSGGRAFFTLGPKGVEECVSETAET